MPSVFDFATVALAGAKLPITVTGDDTIVQALTANTAFPPAADGKNTLGQLSFATPSGKWQLPGLGAQDVSFQASASSRSIFAAYTNASQLSQELGFQGDDGSLLNLSLPATAGRRYLALDWTLDATAAGAGSLVLAPAVSASVGLGATANGRFAFVRSVDAALPVRDACAALLSGWTSPGALVKGSALPEGCWIVTEADGSLSANLGLKAGYDFNWVKSLDLNQLSGDLGLRIALSLESTLSATVEARFYVVVSRDPGQDQTRVRIFRKRGANAGIALNAGANITPSTGSLTPDRLDDFIKAIFGIHDAQLLTYLTTADANTIVEGLGETFLEKLCDTTGIQPDIQHGFASLQALLQQWNALPHTVATVLWKYAGDATVLARLQQVATTLAAGDPNAIHALLDSVLKDTSFYNNPVCEWLEAASSQTLFQLYDGPASEVQKIAKQVLPVLDGPDGSALQATLTRLAAQVGSALNLPALEAAIGQQNLLGTAQWVAQQLAHFLGVDPTHLQPNLGKLNAVLTTLRTRSADLYAATRKALNTTYGFTLTAAYNASSEQSALIDASFAPGAQSHLAEALLGRFDTILAGPLPGVTLNVGTLTHALTRNSHVAIHLPWWNGAADDLAKASTTTHFVDGVDGRVQLFDTSATDLTTLTQGASLQRFASCSVGLSGLAPGVHKYNVQAVNFGFSSLTLAAGTTAQQLTYALKDAAQVYFPSTFASDAAFAGFVAGLSAAVPPGQPNLGTVWASLQVNLLPTGDVDWIARLLNGAAPDYDAMSRSMQASIRFWLLKAYAANPKRLTNIAATQPFLVYAALSPLNGVSVDSSGTLLPARPHQGNIVWDTLDPAVVEAVCRAYAMPGLTRITQNVADVLGSIPALKGSAAFYAGQASQTLHAALQWPSSGASSAPLIGYLQAEKTVIDNAQQAFHGLQKAGAKQLQQALPAFAASLLKLVQTFNKDLANLSLDAPELMRDFAPIVLNSAIDDMFGSALEFQRDALLDVALLKSPTLPASSDSPGPADTIRRQRVLTS